MCKSKLFTAFNCAKALTERGRLNRALGLALRNPADAAKYVTTQSFCNCPDFTYRSIRCKHIIALVLKLQAQED
jgi:predicted nucleic acid-binding Zn finger protein